MKPAFEIRQLASGATDVSGVVDIGDAVLFGEDRSPGTIVGFRSAVEVEILPDGLDRSPENIVFVDASDVYVEDE